MKISEILQSHSPMLSFEVFPPKTEASFSAVSGAVEQIARLKPSFMSVTFGAAGTTSEYTLEISKKINALGITPLAHLTCVNNSEARVESLLGAFREDGIENIMALRGDIPVGGERGKREFLHASDLVKKIKSYGDFCVGGACYPEGHVECATRREDIGNLKKKVEAGADFLTTQMFFDNDVFYNYLYHLREEGITVPVIAGIMPVTNAKQIARICSLSGTYLPERFKRIVDRFGDNEKAMKQAGVAYATEQIVDLYANGVNAVHVYSMNKPEVAEAIRNSLSEIVL